MVGLVAPGDDGGLEGVDFEIPVAAEDLDEGAFAGGVDDQVGPAVGSGLGVEDRPDAAGEIQVVRVQRERLGVADREVRRGLVFLGGGVAMLAAGEGAFEDDDGRMVLALADVDADVELGVAGARDSGWLVGQTAIGDDLAVEELGGGGDEGALVLLGVIPYSE